MGGGVVDLRLCQSAKKSTKTTLSLIYDFYLSTLFRKLFGEFPHHFSRLAQYAADILPLLIFLACRALKLARFYFIAALSPALGLLMAISGPTLS
jgi:hypothetical protein